MPTDWPMLPTLIAAYAGPLHAAEALVPALRTLRRRTACQTLFALWPEEAELPLVVEALVDAHVSYGGGAERAAITRLSRWGARPADPGEPPTCGAIIFTHPGEAAFTPAYLCYLAGIRSRAGITREFGGGVLSHAIPPPEVPMPAEEHHLHLLRMLGISCDHQFATIAADPQTCAEDPPTPVILRRLYEP